MLVKYSMKIIIGVLLLVGLFLLVPWIQKENIFIDSQPIDAVAQKYHDPIYNFSLELPPDFSWQTYDEGDEGVTITFYDQLRVDSFQIAVSPYEGDPTLTRERILQDLPSTIIKEPKEVVIGGNQHALIFESEDKAIGPTREVWFVNKGFLYAITTYKHLDSWLAKILTTWRWE